MYLFGNGMLARDLDRARSFLSAAAMRGVPKSAADLVVTIISSSRALDDLREAAKWIKVAQFIDGPEATETTTELLRLAAGSMDLTVGYQAGARWIQNYRNKGGVNENRPCTSS
jgi:TPR repeat protein